MATPLEDLSESPNKDVCLEASFDFEAMKLSCTPNARRRSRGEPDSEPAHAATPDLPIIRSLNFGGHAQTPQWGQDAETPSPMNSSLIGQSREQPRLPPLNERHSQKEDTEARRPLNRNLAFDAFPALPRELVPIPPSTRLPADQPEREPQVDMWRIRDELDMSFKRSPVKQSQSEETNSFADFRKRTDAQTSQQGRAGSFQQNEGLDQFAEPSSTRTDVCNGADFGPNQDAFQLKGSLTLSELSSTQEDEGGKIVPRRGKHHRPSMRWSEIACKSRELSRHNSLETMSMNPQRSISRNSFSISRTCSTDLVRQPSFEGSIGPALDCISFDESITGDYLLEESRQPPTPGYQHPQPRQVNRTASFVAMDSGLAPAAGDEPRLATLVRSTSSVPSGSPISFPANSPYCTPRGIPARSLLRSPPEVDRLGVAPEDELLRGDDNDCRFEREFEERSKVGEGHFSTVWKARNSVDSCWYAIKRTKQRIVAPGQKPNHRAVREAFALASVEAGGEPCPNIVRYYSSWFESGQLFIQMELCDGSLRDHLKTLQAERSDPRCTDTEIVEIISQVANGLNCMHRLQFVHLDIKPDNIMRSRSKTANKWKIGDLGLAEIALTGHDDICEGDCRYLAREVLNGDFSRPSAADVFSLGLMAYEVGTNPRPLPGCGEEWHILREGILDPTFLPNMPPALWDLLQYLVRPSAWERPDCEQILEHPAIKPKMKKDLSVEDFERLREELEASKNTDIENLVQMLQAAEERARRYKHEAAAAAVEAASFREQLAAQAALLSRSKATDKNPNAVVSRRPNYMRRNTM
mmetsp:Transcript_68154/g.142399  ORF Transcript_68154/g.142399 Transcript_68154/m.142399 type:complete len:810 (-) Transcript_68154:152-2581(-)